MSADPIRELQDQVHALRWQVMVMKLALIGIRSDAKDLVSAIAIGDDSQLLSDSANLIATAATVAIDRIRD